VNSYFLLEVANNTFFSKKNPLRELSGRNDNNKKRRTRFPLADIISSSPSPKKLKVNQIRQVS